MRWLAVLGLVGCGPVQTSLPPTVTVPTAVEGVARIALLGDSGEVGPGAGVAAACVPDGGGHVITADCRERLRDAVRAVAPDLVVDLGDLVYEQGPSCPEDGLTDAARATLDDVLGAYLLGLDAPAAFVLGNHDLAQLPGKEASLRCYLDWAEEHGVLFPERNFLVDVGPVLLTALDSNRPPEGALLDALRDAVDARRADVPDGWVVAAAHHPVRTYRDDAVRPARMRPWVDAAGLAWDAWTNGHAHFQQLVVDDGLPDVTTGDAARSLRIAPCDGDDAACGPGERFGWGDGWGFALLEADADRLTVTFHDVVGDELYRWSRGHDDPEGTPR